ncbi:pentatricopeptide repeat-containing protein [Tripterygium wilfordii]|uniref:Pentatricopeptide repeat-containing protein n=1 Tax=Tripterygium wilfordii TaxID=458696 RepID=A0A7J7C4R8_TRIWF|nr:pentatricopeptide repeat-containing protein [Tripterygium wilfordii]
MWAQALELLETMVSEHQKPNMITYSTLINGLCKEGKLQEAVEILDRMKLQGVKPDAGLCGEIINGFCDYASSRRLQTSLMRLSSLESHQTD